MRTPTAHHIEGFFLGGEHLLRMAESHVNDNPNARTSAIVAMQRKEMTTLALTAARPSTQRKPREGAAVRQQNSPETPNPKRGAFLAACTLTCEILFVVGLFGALFIAPWAYFALTGEMLDFGANK